MTLDGQVRAKLWSELLPRYSEPHRHYHNVQHIEECLREFAFSEHLARDSVAVELAILFHDAIYDPRRHDNEEQSVELAITFLKEVALGSAAESVAALILATKHNVLPSDVDAQLLVDIDLAILGQPESRFDEYEAQIRGEYSFVPEEVFRRKRAEILERFLARPQIYRTEFFIGRYEKSARSNLMRSLKQLRGY